MDVQKVIKELERRYPNKNIIKNDENNLTEILCEIDPSSVHPEYSLAIAVIDKSVPHYHKKTTETYKVIKGSLVIYIDGIKKQVKAGGTYKIPPGILHWAKGDETWVECNSEPGWVFDDHIIVDLEKIVKDIVTESLSVLEKYDLKNDIASLDYVDIFPKNEEEAKYLSAIIKTIGKPVYKTSTGITHKLEKPIQTEMGGLSLLRVRMFDKTRTDFKGHPDYVVEDYSKVKEKLLKKNNVNLIEREDYELLEIWDEDFDVLVYIPNVPLGTSL